MRLMPRKAANSREREADSEMHFEIKYLIKAMTLMGTESNFSDSEKWSEEAIVDKIIVVCPI